MKQELIKTTILVLLIIFAIGFIYFIKTEYYRNFLETL